MKPIEERAKEYVKRVYDGNYTDVELGFIRGAQSEHSELTRWNSPDCPPDNERQVLMQLRDITSGDTKYSVGRYDGYGFNGSGFGPGYEIIGWREIH